MSNWYVHKDRRWYRVEQRIAGYKDVTLQGGIIRKEPQYEVRFVDVGATGSNRGPNKKGRRHRKADVKEAKGQVIAQD